MIPTDEQTTRHSTRAARKASAQQTYDPHCHLAQGYKRADSLVELQKLVSNTLRRHCPLSGLGALAEATGHESRETLASYLHITQTQLTVEQEIQLRSSIIPGLRVVYKQVCAPPTEHTVE